MSSLRIVEVGPASYTNMSGTGNGQDTFQHASQRLLILQPTPTSESYTGQNNSLRLWQRFFGYEIITADIYQPGNEQQIQTESVGVALFQSIIDDPEYSGKKDVDRLSVLLTHILTPGGLAIMATTSPVYANEYQPLCAALGQNDRFLVVLDEITGSPVAAEVKVNSVLDILQPMNIVDEALVAGLTGAALDLWMVFQKK